MSGIGALFRGASQGFVAGAGLAQRNTLLRQRQQAVDLDAAQQEFTIEQLRNTMRDTQTTAQALGGITKTEQADAQMFSMMKSARELAAADPSMRKTQFPVFAENFKKATGRDMAPNVKDAFMKGDATVLTALLDNATTSVLKNNGKAEDVLELLTDPTRSAAWLASQSAKINGSADAPNVTSPKDNALQNQILVLKRQANIAQQKADAMSQVAGQQTTADGLKNVTELMTTFQKQADDFQTKIADLSKPQSLSAGGAIVDPTTGETVAKRDRTSKLLTPEEQAQAVDLAGRKATAGAKGRLDAFQHGLSDDAIERAAARYNVDGSMPTIGRGPQALKFRLQILDEAGRQQRAAGNTAEESAIDMQFNKAALSGMRQLEAQRQKLATFEQTALKNADLTLKLSAKADRTGVPVFNRWLLAGQKAIAGDPQVTAYDVALRGFINEYARIVTTATGGGVLTDTARKEMEDILNRAQTHEQLVAGIETAKIEMQNRITSFKEEFDDVRSAFQQRLSGSRTGNAPANGTPTEGEGKVVNWEDL